MANKFVRSADGSDADNGTTWALAKATLAGALAVASAGDTIYVSHNHNEATGSNVVLTFPGTLAAPVKVICVDSTGDPTPPTTLATSAVVSSTSGWGLALASGAVYSYGINYICDASASNFAAGLFFGGDSSPTQYSFQGVFENCVLWNKSAHTGSFIATSDNTAHADKGTCVILKNCTVGLGNASQKIYNLADMFWDGGSLNTSLAVPTVLIDASGSNVSTGRTVIRGVDLSGMGSGKSLVNVGGPRNGPVDFVNCKLGASVALTTGSQTALSGPTVTMTDCDSGSTNYRSQLSTPCGNVFSETTIIRTGGASDGTTGLSWKMATGSNASFPMNILRSTEIVQWNETTGSSKTVTAEIVHDSQGAGASSAFQDDEIWLEVQYLGTSGFPQSTFITDCEAGPLATAADQTSSSETWTTTGLTTPVKQKLSVTFTPQKKGYIHATICMAKASKTAYVCPKITVA